MEIDVLASLPTLQSLAGASHWAPEVPEEQSLSDGVTGISLEVPKQG